MQEYTSLETSKKIYEMFGWGTANNYTIYMTDAQKHMIVPTYTLPHLLDKLPKQYQGEALELFVIGNRWTAQYDDGGIEDNEYPNAHADTPVEAAALLCLELGERGILPRKDK